MRIDVYGEEKGSPDNALLMRRARKRARVISPGCFWEGGREGSTKHTYSTAHIHT